MKNLFFVVAKELFTPGTLNYLINVEEGIKVGVGKAKKNKQYYVTLLLAQK